MTHICFVSYEIFPTTWGGCGALLHNAAHVLLSHGHEVVFVLDLRLEEFDRFQHLDRLALPHSDQCRAYHVDSLCATMDVRRDDFATEAQWRAYRFHIAVQQVAAIESPDVIEFFDYCGVGHYAMAAKAAGLSYQHNHLVVRLHNSLELMDAYEATNPLSLERFMYYALEHSALQMAETILHPSSSYLTKAYQPLYEDWWGQQVFSKPPLVSIPQRQSLRLNPNKILFYGRLFGFKGVDRFVDAAVGLLHTDSSSDTEFVLVGYDALRAPDGSASYETYLRKKVPAQFQDRFVFTGQIKRTQLELLLASVRFAVFPSYLEAFCYAAHELYAAGVPIIVSDIPNFNDYFHHDTNALVFNGSTDDLAYQMKRLNEDPLLRQQITLPFPVADEPLGYFYEGPFTKTWIEPVYTQPRLSLLVCVIADTPPLVATTLQTLDSVAGVKQRVVILHPYEQSRRDNAALWLLGQLYNVTNRGGQNIAPTDLRTAEILLIVRAGDVIDPEYIQRGLDILAQQTQIAFVGSWKHIVTQASIQLDTFPLDNALELAPLRAAPTLNRVLMRTTANHLLMDLFDTQAGAFGEMLYLWHLDTSVQRGLVIPKPLITQYIEPLHQPSPALLSYFIAQTGSAWRRKRLTQYIATIEEKSGPSTAPTPLSLSSIVLETKQDITIYRRVRNRLVRQLHRNQHIGQPMLFILRIGRSIAQTILAYEKS